MRILHVIDSLGRGGAERVVATLAKGQASDSEVGVVSLFGPNDVAEELRGSGVQVFTLNLDSPRQLVRTALALRRVVQSFRPDVVHAHLTFALLAVGMVPMRGVRRIGTFHNLGLAAGRVGGVTTRVVRALLAVLSRTSFDVLTGVSAAASVGYQRELRLDVAPIVVSNPVDVDALRAAAPQGRAHARERLHLPQSGPLLVCVAKFTWEKGHDVLFRAIAAIPAEQRPRLALVGDGPLRDELRALARELQIEERLVWCGELDHGAALAWMVAADALVLPSRSEGQPVTVLEAMALGVPVVGSSVGGVPELLGDGRGTLVRPERPDELSMTLSRVLRSPDECSSQIRAARLWVEEDFSVRRVTAHWNQLFVPETRRERPRH